MYIYVSYIDIYIQLFNVSAEIVRAMTFVINQGMAMYWGTSRWSAMEIMVGLKKKKKKNLDYVMSSASTFSTSFINNGGILFLFCH